jgi:hypothetical protein
MAAAIAQHRRHAVLSWGQGSIWPDFMTRGAAPRTLCADPGIFPRSKRRKHCSKDFRSDSNRFRMGERHHDKALPNHRVAPEWISRKLRSQPVPIAPHLPVSMGFHRR